MTAKPTYKELEKKVKELEHSESERKLAEKGIKRNEEITHTLFSISNAINTTDNLDDLYRSIYDSLNLLIELPNFFICLLDEKKDVMYFPFYRDEYDSEKTIAYTVDYCETNNYISTDVIKNKKPILLTKDMLDKRCIEGTILGAIPKIWLGVPLVVRDKVIGVMAAQHYHDPDYFSQRDMDLFISISDQVAIAIDRRQFQDDLREANDKAEQTNQDLQNEINERKYSENINKALFAISNAVNVTLNLDDLYSQIHNFLGEIVDITNFFIAILNNKERTLHFPYHQDRVDEDYSPIKNFNPTNSLTGLVVSKCKPMLLTKENLKDLSDKKAIWGAVPMIWMGVPLMIKDEVIGVIAVQSYTDPYLYDKHDLEVLTSISDQVAIAIDRKRTEDELRESEKKYRYIFNNAPAGMYEIDFTKRKFIEVNEVLCKYTGYSEDEFLSINPLDLLADKSKKKFIEAYETVLNGGKISSDVEYNIIKKNGQILYAVLKSDYTYKKRKLVGARVVVHDITKRKAMEDNLKRLASTDSLTGANNRRSFLEKGTYELLRSRRYNHPFSFLMMDIDHFKAVNDTYGHQVGDEVLKKLVSQSNKLIRATDFLGRLGGEEFGVILPETDNETAMEVGERLRIEMSKISIDSDQGQVQFTVSIGLSMLEKKTDTLVIIMDRADSALYKAKEGGRNCLVKI
jgi:diguanylate cyclase (GGDEF)-like protein/PAS domain S-box-containing protein